MFADIIENLDFSDPKKVQALVFSFVRKIEKDFYEPIFLELFLLLSELTTNRYSSICIDAMLYTKESPESSIDYSVFEKFLVNQENYE